MASPLIDAELDSSGAVVCTPPPSARPAAFTVVRVKNRMRSRIRRRVRVKIG